jgi:membrane protease subunit HflK
MTTTHVPPSQIKPPRSQLGLIGLLFRLSVIALALLAVSFVTLIVGQAVVYKIQPYQRGLHMSGGVFVGIDYPGWHTQIPFWDTVIVVDVRERQGYVEKIQALTSDEVTMLVSLQYTFLVTDPQRYTFDISDPDRILFELVQGRLRDVLNTKSMSVLMHDRVGISQDVLTALKEKESRYGIQFITVQVQSVYPPAEVEAAIKDKMVSEQRKATAQTDAERTRIAADASYYEAQKVVDGEAYQITKTADAQRTAAKAMLSELLPYGPLGLKYLDYLMVQELKENSKWIFGGSGTPIIDLRGEDGATPTPAPTPTPTPKP